MTEIFNRLSYGFNAILNTLVYLLSFPFFRIFLAVIFIFIFTISFFRLISVSSYSSSSSKKDDEPEEHSTYLNGEKYDG